MSIEQRLQENTAALLALVEQLKAVNLAAPAAVQNSPAPVAETKPVKEKDEAKKPEPTAATEPVATPTTAEQPAAPESKASASAIEISEADVVELMKKVVAAKDRDFLIELLAKHGAKRASELTAEGRAGFAADAQKVLG